jgi:hypothetical protein
MTEDVNRINISALGEVDEKTTKNEGDAGMDLEGPPQSPAQTRVHRGL